MTAVTPRLGKNAKFYRNTATYASPSLSLMTNVKDLKVPQSWGEDDVSARITGGFEAMVTTLLKLSLSFTIFDDDGADIVALRSAFYGQTPVEFFVMNDVVTNTAARGLRMTMLVKKFDLQQGNDKANSYDVEMGITWPDFTSAGTPSAAPVVGASTFTVA